MADANIKPKRPFLKKGSGLRRYAPKSTNSYQIRSNKESPKNLPVRIIDIIFISIENYY